MAFTVICSEPALAAKVETGVRARLERAGVEVSDKFPVAQLFLYLQRDVNDKKNSDGVSVAIAHTSNMQTAALALDLIRKKEAIPDPLAAMLRESGFLKHLNVAHLDEASDEQVNTLLDKVVATLLEKYRPADR